MSFLRNQIVQQHLSAQDFGQPCVRFSNHIITVIYLKSFQITFFKSMKRSRYDSNDNENGLEGGSVTLQNLKSMFSELSNELGERVEKKISLAVNHAVNEAVAAKMEEIVKSTAVKLKNNYCEESVSSLGTSDSSSVSRRSKKKLSAEEQQYDNEWLREPTFEKHIELEKDLENVAGYVGLLNNKDRQKDFRYLKELRFDSFDRPLYLDNNNILGTIWSPMTQMQPTERI